MRQVGQTFRKLMLEEMADNGISLTTEDTQAARMRAVLAGGLDAAEFDAFLTVTGAYEEMNATLETPIPPARRPERAGEMRACCATWQAPSVVQFVGGGAGPWRARGDVARKSCSCKVTNRGRPANVGAGVLTCHIIQGLNAPTTGLRPGTTVSH